MILEKVLLPLGDRLIGQRMMARLRFLRQAQWWDPERLEEERTRRLRDLLAVAWREVPFYRSLCDFMTSGPMVVQVLEGEDAIARNREVMGATDPAKAAPGTIRADFAESIEANCVHGSDAPETAAVEIPFFFAQVDIVG